MRAAVEALPVIAAVLVFLLVFLLATIAAFAARVALVGRPKDAPTVGRWTLAAFFRAWWRWVRRANSARPQPAPRLARVIPIDAARRERAAR